MKTVLFVKVSNSCPQYSALTKNMDSGAKLPEFICQLCYLLAGKLLNLYMPQCSHLKHEGDHNDLTIIMNIT